MAMERQIHLYSERDYDLIIVGGGIYGAMLALESVFRGLKPLLLEKSDFGAATSFNSLRIVHGGLRYLQTLDLLRHFESVRERRWFLKNFPDHVRPLPCLMPLYNKGIKRKTVFRAALLINDALSMRRNSGVMPERKLLNGKIIDRAEVVSAFPGVDEKGLKGAAVWFGRRITGQMWRTTSALPQFHQTKVLSMGLWRTTSYRISNRRSAPRLS
jgi:glycerol-3-phosphate dehydrogenase